MKPGFEHPRVGVAIILRRDGKVLLGRRRGAHGDGTWGLPGGKLDYGEPIEECVLRELAEETGLHAVSNLQRVFYSNDIFEAEQMHFVTLYLQADLDAGEPVRMEPEKCEAWGWFDWDELPAPLFLGINEIVASGYRPY